MARTYAAPAHRPPKGDGCGRPFAYGGAGARKAPGSRCMQSAYGAGPTRRTARAIDVGTLRKMNCFHVQRFAAVRLRVPLVT